ncbi:cytochrome P450 [Streptomyces sp. TRM S81-3]|uniref:Cytochrome P450 n=1 Tax=Streptomyces griseicoloratus TaxID=2752516 RepID=A0A926L6E8_9ACTN|nr:cytochrome P450 [Streptomyces griseicoloratus]MBD0423403.1 cytochrome P450 [Streptomyces griseicoloratus]
MTETTTASTARSPEEHLITFFDPANRPDPYPVLHLMREASPFHAMDGALLVLGRHKDVETVLRSPVASADRSKSRILSTDAVESRKEVMTFLDPPDHTRLRGLVTQAFTPRMVQSLEGRIREIVDDLVDQVARAGSPVDIPSVFSYPVPVRVICEMLGVPPEDHKIFGTWSTVLGRALDPLMAANRTPEIDKEDTETRAAFYQYFRDLIASGGARGEGLLARLVQAEEEGDRLTEKELLATLALLVMAGHETTANLISHGILTLLRHPDQLALLREDPSLAFSAVEEILRFEPSVQILHRMAKEPIRLEDGFEVPAGMDVLLLAAAANRDPEVFDDPDRFDITRASGRRLDHLSFSSGVHRCLGANLGKLEAALALQAFFSRVEDPQVVQEDLEYRPHVILRGPERMRVSFSRVR